MDSVNKSHKHHTTPCVIDNIITAQDVAALLRFKVTTIYALAKSGVLPGFRIGGSWRFIESQVKKCIVDSQLEAKQHPDGKKGIDG